MDIAQWWKAVFLFAACAIAFCQPVKATEWGNRLYFSEKNFLFNALNDVENPVRISYNTVQTLTHVTLQNRFTSGSLHAIDAPQRANDLSASIFGLQRVGRFSLSGEMKYTLTNAREQRWNNTLMLSEDNPFVLADSVSGNPAQELFNLDATACYKFSEQWRAALRLSYETASKDDQTDPRPKTTAMRFRVQPGTTFQLSHQHLLGLNGNLWVYSSDISHTVVDNLNANTYFLMKGMGDNAIVSTGENPSYPRHYQGLQWGAAALWKARFDHYQNVLEAGFSHNDERAEDGGSGPAFKGGDYTSTAFRITNRLAFPGYRYLHQNLLLGFSWQTDQGWWYDQRRRVDTEHGNLVYYEILNKGKVHTANVTKASVGYRIDRYLCCGPSWMLSLKADWEHRAQTHYEADVYKQSYSRYVVEVEGARYFIQKSVSYNVMARAAYSNVIGTPQYASVRGKLDQAYTARVFAFSTLPTVRFLLRTEAVFPLKLYHSPTCLTAFLQGDVSFCTDKSRISSAFNNTSRTAIDVGLSLTL